MLTALTDSTFYNGTYKDTMGECTVPSEVFGKWSLKASNEIRKRTFGNIDESKTIPDDVQMCTCELAEHLYLCNKRDSEIDSTVASEKDGSWSVTYKDRSDVKFSDNVTVREIINTWLANTGLLYCGV